MIGMYYTAQVKPEECWFFVAILRSFEHLCFDRTLDKTQSIFEFFVPELQEPFFVEIMTYFKKQGIISNFTKGPHRLLDENATV